MKRCKVCGSSLSLVDYYRHRLECRTKGRICVHCHRTFEVVSSYHLHIATCLKRMSDKQRMKNQLKNFLPTRGLTNEKSGTQFLKSDVEEAVPLKGPNYSTVCSLCQQSFRSVHLFRLHLAREGLCRPKPYICHTCNREFMSSYHLLSHEKRKKPCKPKAPMASKAGGLKVKFVRKKGKDVKPIHLNDAFNSESSNSVVSEVEFAPINSKNFYAQKTVYEHKDPGVLSMQQYTAERSVMRRKFTCKTCSLVFFADEDLQKHFLVNPTWSPKDSDVPGIAKRTSFPAKQTARKSFPSAGGSALNVTRNEVSMVNSQGHGMAFGSMFAGEEVFLGSARKSSQDSLAVQTQRNNLNEANGLACNICRITFPDFETMQSHRKVHSVEKKTDYSGSKCPVCLQVFSNAFLLFSHQKKHQHWAKSTKSKAAGCKCPFCDKVFLYVRSRNAHLRGHEDVDSESIENFLKKTTCEVCSLAFITESQKIQHRKVEHPDWTDALPKLFSNFDPTNQDSGKRNHEQKKVPEHKQEAAPAKKVKVLVNVTPSLKAKLKAHPNTCPICFKQYSTTFVRNRHFRMHVLDKAFECKWCPTKFHRSEPLNTHMQREHNDKLGFECLVCNLRYLTKFRVLQHVAKSHNSQTPQKLVKERYVPPPPSSMKKAVESYRNGIVADGTENGRAVMDDGKSDYGRTKNNQDFYCEVCETSFLKLCGLQRHRQSKNHKDILATKDPQAASSMSADEPPALAMVQSPCMEPQDMSEEIIGELSCSFCHRVFSGVIDFVPHRLSHFHQTGLSEITEVNPYTCEICMVSVDHHQKVQWHLLHHLQSAKAKKANFGQWRFSFFPRNFEASPLKVSTVRLEKPPGSTQVAKKTLNYKSEKPVQRELSLSKVHRSLFTCDACNVVFTTKHHYSAHIRRYCPVRKAAMGTDGQLEMEKSPNNLRSKWRAHENYPKLICHYCNLEFGTVDELGWHEKSCRKVNGPVNGSLEDNADDFFYCRACECLFPFEHSYVEHRRLFCFEEESLEKLLPDAGEDENLNHLKSAIELEAAVASCVRCGMIFLSVQKLSEHMECHIMEHEPFLTSGKEGENFFPEDVDNKGGYLEQKINQVFTKTNENCGKVSFNIADILSDSSPNKKCENMDRSEISSLGKTVECVGKEEKTVSKVVKSDSITDLRTEFAHLLYILVADPELMEQLGWGQRPIDLVLQDVLKHMGIDPITSDQVNSDSDRLRQNILVLLETCISDDIMSNVSGGKKTIDTIVTEVLQMCRAQAKDMPALPGLVSQINL